MIGKKLGAVLGASAAGIALAFGVAATSLAQPDEDTSSDYTAGDLVVHAPRHQERSWSGAPIVWARASRTVDISDLDLSSRRDVHRLRARVERAAADACDELDNDYVAGLYPTDDFDGVDCRARAVDQAMAAAPISYVETGY